MTRVEGPVDGPVLDAGPGGIGNLSRMLPPGTLANRPWHIVERNTVAYRRTWPVFLTGFAEPVLYLLSIGIGVGRLVGKVPGPAGALVDYRAFVAPGLLAASAMNGSIMDTTFNFFVKLKYARTYDAILATPLDTVDVSQGEVSWAVIRGTCYSAGFLVTMLAFGLVHSWWGLLVVPAAALTGFAFAGAGLALTTFMGSFRDFDRITLSIVPMFLFSGTFFPLSRYPDVLAWGVRCSPLYQGVALIRMLTLGGLTWTALVHIAYLVTMGVVGVRIAARRLVRVLQP